MRNIVATLAVFAASAPAAAGGGEVLDYQGWSGFYFGMHTGAGISETNVTRPGPPGPPPINASNDLDGAIVGGHAGYNFQSGAIVFGVVGDIAATSLKEATANNAGPPSVWETNYRYIATLRARAGYLVDPSLLGYLHGGYALAEIDQSEVGGAGPWGGLSASDHNSGWVIGAGLEYIAREDATLFAEYSYLDFDSTSVTPDGPPGRITFDNDPLHALKVGISFKLY